MPGHCVYCSRAPNHFILQHFVVSLHVVFSFFLSAWITSHFPTLYSICQIFAHSHNQSIFLSGYLCLLTTYIYINKCDYSTLGSLILIINIDYIVLRHQHWVLWGTPLVTDRQSKTIHLSWHTVFWFFFPVPWQHITPKHMLIMCSNLIKCHREIQILQVKSKGFPFI